MSGGGTRAVPLRPPLFVRTSRGTRLAELRAEDRMSTEGPISDGELAARISNTVVRALSRTTGRGPTRAKTTLGANGVFVVLQDTLTRGE